MLIIFGTTTINFNNVFDMYQEGETLYFSSQSGRTDTYSKCTELNLESEENAEYACKMIRNAYASGDKWVRIE